MRTVRDIVTKALDYAGAPSAAGGFAAGEIFSLGFEELINSIRNINAEPRYSFGYQIASAVINILTIPIEKGPMQTVEGLATEHYELLFGEQGELITLGDPRIDYDNYLDFDGLIPYRIAKVYDSLSGYARCDRAELMMDRGINRSMGTRRFAFNQESEDMAILELSHMVSGPLTVIAEKQLREPADFESVLDLPANVYKFLMLWTARSLAHGLGNKERESELLSELNSNEKPFAVTNERNKRDYRINTRSAFARLGS